MPDPDFSKETFVTSRFDFKRELFINFCVRTGLWEPLFYLTVFDFKRLPSREKAVTIYLTFLAADAPLQVNVGENFTPERLEQNKNFHNDLYSNYPSPEIFDRIAISVWYHHDAVATSYNNFYVHYYLPVYGGMKAYLRGEGKNKTPVISRAAYSDLYQKPTPMRVQGDFAKAKSDLAKAGFNLRFLCINKF